jgi:ribosomal protein L37AE/L43A
MAPRLANPVGDCPACDRKGVPLGTSKHIDAGVRICGACAKAASKAAAMETGKPEPSTTTPADDPWCPKCKEPAELVSSKYHAVPICRKCLKKVTNAAYRERQQAPKPPAGPERPIKIKLPSGRVFTGFASAADPTAVQTGHSNGRAVVLTITCHEIADVRRVLEATKGLSCAIGLEGAA